VSLTQAQGQALRFEKKISIPSGSIFFQNPAPAKHSPFYAHETKHSILRLFKRIKKMSEMKTQSITTGKKVKQNSSSSHCRINKISKKVSTLKIQKS